MSWSTYGKKNSTTARQQVAAVVEPVASVSVQYSDETDQTALLRIYDMGVCPQPCYIELDLEDGRLGAGYYGGDGIPFSVRHGRTIHWNIPPLQSRAVNRILREIAPLAQTIADNSDIAWDGNNNVGELSKAAEAARDEIGRLLGEENGRPVLFDDHDHIHYALGCDWFAEGLDELRDEVRERGVDAVYNEYQGAGISEDYPNIPDLRELLEELAEAE
jgi:hypothetical protein